jgi:GT2 family glycosyltransferase/glycosyltransferase involved in cell wall biosynthesis
MSGTDQRGWPRLAVVVPNFNGAAHLEACFGSLEALDYPADQVEPWLVDNASHDDSLAILRRRFPRVRILRNQSNLGFAAACNQGVAAADAPYVALLNNDARVDAAWARELVGPLLERPALAATGAKMLDWAGERVDFAGGLLNFYGHAFQHLYGAPASAAADLTLRPTLFACGGAMAVRRDVFLAVGGFDESYFAFFEDVDLGWRLWLHGYAVALAPRAVAYHRGHATASRLPAHQLRVLYERNALYTIVKNYDDATLERVLPAALLLAAQRGLMSGRVETAPYVLGQDGGGPSETVPRLALSYFLALGEVGLKLDEVWAHRAAVQRARQRPDAAILPLFGEPFMPNHVDPRYLETQERLVRTFGLDRLFSAGALPGLDDVAPVGAPSPPAPLPAGEGSRFCPAPAGDGLGLRPLTDGREPGSQHSAPQAENGPPPLRVGEARGDNSLAHHLPPGEGQDDSSPVLPHTLREGRGASSPILPLPLGEGRGEGAPALAASPTAVAAPLLLVCGDPVGATMAGPGVRAWEMARALGRAGVPVLLAVPNADPPGGEGFRVVSYAERPERLMPLAGQASAVLVQGFLLQKAPGLSTLGKPLVVDLYDPFILENLAFFARDRLPFRQAIHGEHLGVLNEQLQAGDFFLCASERQRDYWLGMLAANDRVNPATYDADPTLRALIDVVPYGLPPEPPRALGPVLKGVEPGIAATDRVILWGGGLWDWFDPLTLVRALARVVAERPDVRLVFLGTRHPNAALPPMAMPGHTRELAVALGLADRHVYFRDWVPYAERAAYLLEADLGVSLHPDSVETRFAFRSRLLDCFWAGLPLVCTRGDALADLVEREGLGQVVPPGDDAAVASALLTLLAEPDLRASLAPRFARVAATLTWDRAVAPLAAYCRAPHRAPDRDAVAPSPAEPASPLTPRLGPAPARALSGWPWPRRQRTTGGVSVISYVVRPTPWWRLPLRAWYFLQLGGPRRLEQEVRGYVRWLRARGLSSR